VRLFQVHNCRINDSTGERHVTSLWNGGYQLNLPTADSIDDGKGVLVDGVTVASLFDDEVNSEIYAYADIGAIDKERRLEIFENISALR
jgi:hypothetical protein